MDIKNEQIQRRLVIRIGQGSLSFVTANADGVTYEPYAMNSSISMAANLREALRSVPLLSESFDRTLVMIDSPVLIVPLDTFAEGQKTQLYQHAFSDLEHQVVMHAVLPDLNSVAVFSVHRDLRTVIGDTFSAVRYIPVVAPVWHHLHQRSYTGQHQKLFAYFHERRLEVFSFAQNRFKFSNSFAVNNPNDALYYLLSVWKQLGMTPERDEMYLVGDAPERDALLEETKKFVKRVFYVNPSGEFNRAPVAQIEGIPYDLVTLFMRGER